MEITLEGKRALVTGGNMGIGRAIVEAFAASGARVAINYMAHQRAAEDLCREIGAKYDRPALAIEADVSDAERIVFAAIDEAWGGLDILVNNAGIEGSRELGWEARSEDWRHVIDVNLGGAFHCAQEALQRMVPAGSGVIINITSVHELIPWAGYSAYAASKAGLYVGPGGRTAWGTGGWTRAGCGQKPYQSQHLGGFGATRGTDGQDTARSTWAARGCGQHGSGAGLRCGGLCYRLYRIRGWRHSAVPVFYQS